MITFNNFEISGFHGFYNSIWENADSDWQYFNDDENLIGLLSGELDISDAQAAEILTKVGNSNDKCIGDYVEQHFSQYCNDVVAAYASIYFEALADELQCDIVVKSQTLWSPREYNFTSDRIFVDIECDDEFVAKLLAKVQEHREKLEKYIEEGWKSGDGFVSHVPNQLAYWEAVIVNEHSLDEYRQSMMSVLARYIVDPETEHICWSLEDTIYSKIEESYCTQAQYYYIPDEKKQELRTILQQI